MAERKRSPSSDLLMLKAQLLPETPISICSGSQELRQKVPAIAAGVCETDQQDEEELGTSRGDSSAASDDELLPEGADPKGTDSSSCSSLDFTWEGEVRTEKTDHHADRGADGGAGPAPCADVGDPLVGHRELEDG